MAFAPPANNAGLPVPAIPANPPILSNITNTKDYVQRLIQSKGKYPLTAERRQLIWVRIQPLALRFAPQTTRLAPPSCTVMKVSLEPVLEARLHLPGLLLSPTHLIRYDKQLSGSNGIKSI
jgi:hypothetical protein